MNSEECFLASKK